MPIVSVYIIMATSYTFARSLLIIAKLNLVQVRYSKINSVILGGGGGGGGGQLPPPNHSHVHVGSVDCSCI